MKKIISVMFAILLVSMSFNCISLADDEINTAPQSLDGTRTQFDENNIIMRFGVVSDVHQNGYYAGTMSSAQVQEWAHTIDVFQKTAAADGAVLDAILINGDLTDGVNGDYNVGSFARYGDKAMQNMRESGHFAKGVWGSGNGVSFTEEKKVIDNTASADGYMSATSVNGFGNGFDDTTKLFYVLGNHDEVGRGKSISTIETIDEQELRFSTVHSASYFGAVICGWQHNPDSEEALNNSIGGAGEYQDGLEHSYIEYFNDLIDYNTNASTNVTAEGFAAKYGVALNSADALFDRYYGHLDFDTTLTDKDNGITFGNSHMTIDPNPENGTDSDRIHFIGVELSQSNESCAWAEELIKTSVAEDPSKPIFVITHFKMPGTMFGDSGSSIIRLREVIKNYPQVIIFGGHSHTTLHTENAINSERGFVAVETNSTRYMSTTTPLTLKSMFGTATSNNDTYPHTPYNYPSHEAAVSNGCYVEVDKNNNVRINRMDLFRSFSTDYTNDTSFYVANKFVNFDNHTYNKDFVAVDEPVFIREPWDITDIETGKHLDDFNTTTRTLNTEKPYFEDASSIAAESVIGGLNIEMTLNAKDNDGMVMLYVLEVKDKTEKVVHRRYYTNYFYEFPQSDASLAGNNIAVIKEKAAVTDLEPGKYTVSLYAVDDYYVPGEAITATANALSGKVNVKLDDGRTAVFVDTTGENENYIWKDGIDYLVHNSYESAIATGADVIYVIKSPHVSGSLYNSVITKQKKALEIIGISENREDTVLSWINTHNVISNYNLTLTNMALNKEKTGDCGVCITNGRTLTLNDCLAVGDGINIFTGFGNGTKTGNLVINGDTGNIKNVWASSVKSYAANVQGDVNITVTGGNFTSYFPAMKYTNTAGYEPNILDGNLYVNVSGGTFSHAVRASIPSYTAVISKNAVFRITGGTMPSIGQAGKSYITGKEVYIVTDAVLANTKYNVSKFPENNTAKSILINVPANEGGIGNATFDSNGIITKFAVKQVAGKESLVNGVAATSISLTEGKTYTVTYKTTNAISFDLNGGEGVVPKDIADNINENVTASMPDGTGISRENHTFLGWSTDKNATVPDTSFIISDSIVVVYAVWKENIPVTITLNANGGLCDKSALNGFKDEKISLPSASMNGALFAGWPENANASSKDAITDLTLTESKTLYAIYISRKPSVAPIITVDYPTFCSGIMNGADTATVTKGCLEDGVNCIKVVPNQSSTQNGDIVLDSYIGIAYPDGFAKGSTLANAKYAAVKYKYVCPDGNGSAQKMGIRILKNGGILEASSSNVYAINSPVNNEWSYVYFDVSDICSNVIEEGVLRQLHVRPFGTGVTPVNTADGEMFYIGEITFYEEDPTVIRHYDITIDYNDEGGIASANKENAQAGDDINLTIIPNNGYEIESVKYNDGINDVVITAIDGVYSFKMPPVNVKVSAKFKLQTVLSEITVNLIREDGSKPFSVTYDDGTSYSSATKLIIEKNGEEIYSATEDADNDNGQLKVNIQLAPGKYTLKIMKPCYLTYCDEIDVTAGGVNSREIKLIPGDIRATYDELYGDGVIDIDDFIRVLRGFNSNLDVKLKNSVDINEDGYVNVTDLAMIKANLGKDIDNYHE